MPNGGLPGTCVHLSLEHKGFDLDSPLGKAALHFCPPAMARVGPLSQWRGHASLYRVPSGCKPDECKDGEAQTLLRFEGVGLTDVKTVPSSGNVVFDARAKSETALTREVEAAMAKQLGCTFYMIVRPASVLRPRGPVFMTLIEKTFGANVTTRTWDTVKKCATASRMHPTSGCVAPAFARAGKQT